MPLLMQASTWLAIISARVHWWLVFSLVSNRALQVLFCKAIPQTVRVQLVGQRRTLSLLTVTSIRKLLICTKLLQSWQDSASPHTKIQKHSVKRNCYSSFSLMSNVHMYNTRSGGKTSQWKLYSFKLWLPWYEINWEWWFSSQEFKALMLGFIHNGRDRDSVNWDQENDFPQNKLEVWQNSSVFPYGNEM